MSDKSAEENAYARHEFVRRLFALPVVANAYDRLSSFYCGAKERNRLLRLTMETAESGMGVIVHTAQPVLSRFDKQMLVLDNIACTRLDWLENSYPIITKPTDEVVKETKEKCTGAIQPVVNCVGSVKDYGFRKVSGFRTYAGDKIEGIKQYGAGTVSAASKVGGDQLTKILSIQLCREFLDKFDAALDIADRRVDNFLPESTCSNKENESNKATETDVIMLSKAYKLSRKVQRRLYVRVAKRLEKVQLRAKETITKLNLVVNWIELTRSNVSGAKEKAWHIWQEILKTEDPDVREERKEDGADHDSKFDRRAISVARQLITKLRGVVSWVDSSVVFSVRNVPGMVQERLRSSVALVQMLPEPFRERVTALGKMVQTLSDAFSKETVSMKDLPQSLLNNTKNTLHQLYRSFSDLLHWTLNNTPGYHTIEQIFRKSFLNSNKSNSSSFSEESKTEKRNQQLYDQNNEENSDDVSSKHDSNCKNREFEDKNQ